MTDPIERSAAIEALWHSIEDECGGELQSYAEAVISDAEDAIKALPPAVDAVPVVRCKDCKHLSGAGMLEYCAFGTPHPNGFCSYGGRKDGKDGER